MAGHITAADQTNFLTTKGYWPSFNAPFYPDIANMSGMVGDWDSAPRHAIFRRNGQESSCLLAKHPSSLGFQNYSLY